MYGKADLSGWWHFNTSWWYGRLAVWLVVAISYVLSPGQQCLIRHTTSVIQIDQIELWRNTLCNEPQIK